MFDVVFVTLRTRADVPPPVIVPVIEPVVAPLHVIVPVWETLVKVKEAVLVKLTEFEANVFPQESVTVTT